ncbi:fructan beta-fructosidase [Arthrobacter globiformis]|uniref:glycoside hydrolase family 32 protein n=1 Tax=Arthrobacter globiformis TaxID=1665 RepID=UPI0027801CA3|nr:glycoside hydrolase family 32 protein [Arthrobacter globiformis]MDQ1057031.1 fructan beta-fructosidase [Arthrobacter globiformis]
MTETTTHPAGPAEETALNIRPILHYTAKNTWLNDPNGLIYSNGIYHLYYQNNPYGNVWGNMAWGHATSTDLTTWTEHPVAIPGDEEEDIFSGSIVIDHLNTSGFGTEDRTPWVAVYTSAFKDPSPHRGTQAQSLAYSLDEGMTWSKFTGNPVLSRGSLNFRDPKVFWYEGPAGSYWVMVAVEAQEQKVLLYRSENLKDWDQLSEFGPANATGGEWECPDLFPLPLDNDPLLMKWVLTVNINPGAVAGGSGGQYFIGNFDGTSFIQDEHDDSPPVSSEAEPTDTAQQLRKYNWLDWGRDYYAAVSFSNVPDNRRIMIGWMNNWDYANDTPTSPWRSAMSVARDVTLRTIGGRPAVIQQPAFRLPDHGVHVYEISDQVELNGTPVTFPGSADGTALIVRAEFQTGTASRLGLILGSPSAANADSRTDIVYDTGTSELAVDRTKSGHTTFHPLFPSVESCPLALYGKDLTLEIIIDRCSLEVFAQNGQVAITDLIFPARGQQFISAFAEGGDATLKKLTITEVG